MYSREKRGKKVPLLIRHKTLLIQGHLKFGLKSTFLFKNLSSKSFETYRIPISCKPETQDTEKIDFLRTQSKVFAASFRNCIIQDECKILNFYFSGIL